MSDIEGEKSQFEKKAVIDLVDAAKSKTGYVDKPAVESEQRNREWIQRLNNNSN